MLLIHSVSLEGRHTKQKLFLEKSTRGNKTKQSHVTSACLRKESVIRDAKNFFPAFINTSKIHMPVLFPKPKFFGDYFPMEVPRILCLYEVG